MKPLTTEERAVNVGVEDPQRCLECGDDGWIEYAVQEPPFAEEMAPCPFCMKGWRIEWGHGKKRMPNNKLVDAINPKPPWGSDGFWRGRDIPERKFPDNRPPALVKPTPEQQEQLAAFATE